MFVLRRAHFLAVVCPYSIADCFVSGRKDCEGMCRAVLESAWVSHLTAPRPLNGA